MTMLDKMAMTWGLEDPATVEGFRKAEEGATEEELREYFEKVEGEREKEWNEWE